ncbi:MAG: alpha/beta hydrolase [Solirubrobacterales bacterium]|nr:alpha/beta hydrolase [Solirubrobacterales bacterium]
MPLSSHSRRRSMLACAAAAAAGLALVGALPGSPAGDPRATDATASTAVRATEATVPPATGAALRERPPAVLRDVPYLGGRGPLLDVHRPAGAGGRRAAVIVVHGGAWSAGDKAAIGHVARAVAAAGMVAINVNYTLVAPGRPGYPRQTAELAAAVAWVRANAHRIGVDPDRIGALGSSAGGHLLALLATSRRSRLGALVTWSAPFDLGTQRLRRRLRAKIAGYLGCSPCPRRAAAASPLTHAGAGDPPLLIVNSRRELIPADQARRMAARLRLAGAPRQLLLVPGRLHAPHYSPAVLDTSLEFLARRLR